MSNTDDKKFTLWLTTRPPPVLGVSTITLARRPGDANDLVAMMIKAGRFKIWTFDQATINCLAVPASVITDKGPWSQEQAESFARSYERETMTTSEILIDLGLL